MDRKLARRNIIAGLIAIVPGFVDEARPALPELAEDAVPADRGAHGRPDLT